jgi:NADH-quinone oxidoreductase subunit L
MTIPLIVLGALAVFSGYHFHHGIPQPWAFDKEGWFLEIWRNPIPFELTASYANPEFVKHVHEAEHHAHGTAMMASLAVAGFGILLSFLFYSRWAIFSPVKWAKGFGPIYTLVVNKYYFDELYDKTAIAGSLVFSKCMSLFDKYVIDGLVNAAGAAGKAMAFGSATFDRVVVDGLVNFTGFGTQALGSVTRLLQTGRIQQYLTFSMFALVAVAAVLILR